MIWLDELRSKYQCADYFDGPYASVGFFDDRAQFEVIAPVENCAEKYDAGFLSIGRAGTDGIEFGYREGMGGVWAHYPIDNCFSLVAPSVTKLVEGWSNGSIKV